MSIKDWYRSFFGKQINGDAFYQSLEATIFYKEFALQSCCSIIANALVLSEFNTYEQGKEIKKNNYYLLNIEPNINQNATEFWHEVVTKLIYKNECLIVQVKEQLLIADSYDVDEYATKENLYFNVTIGDLNLQRKFKESEVLFLKLNNKNIKSVIDGLYKDYSKLIGNAMGNYRRSHGRKGILRIKALMNQSEEQQSKLDDLMNNKFKKYFEADNAVLPLSEGLEFEESKIQGNIKDSRDIHYLINDILEFVSTALHIPVGLVKGDIAGVSDQTDNFLMLGVNPIAKLIVTEVNRKIYGKEDFLNRTYVKLDTQKIRNVDLQKVSSAGDLLFRIGVNNINDNLKLLGREPIEEDWANEHYVTKNYQLVLNQDLEGGDTNVNGNGKKNS